MAATIDIEIESGVFTGPIRHHRGYYAGDFSPRPLPAPGAWAAPAGPGLAAPALRFEAARVGRDVNGVLPER